MALKVSQRVSASFDKDDHERITKYIDWILSSATNITQRVQRLTAGMLLLIAIFEVVAQSSEAKVNLAGFSIARNSIVFTFIPVIVAYLYFQMITDTLKAERLTYVFETTFEKWSPKASENNLDVFLWPSALLYWNEGVPIKPNFQDTADKLEIRASWVLVIALLLGILAFEAHAFYVLFNPNLSRDILWLFNACASFFLLLCGIMTIFSGDTNG